MVQVALIQVDKTELDHQLLRRLRNHCREFMTNDTTHITELQQDDWWKRIQHDLDVQPFLFYRADTMEPVGYGMARRIAGDWWVSGGLLSGFRGLGFGTEIFQRLVDRTGVPCWLDVRDTNLAAKATYKKLGFEPVRSVNTHYGKIITMVKR